MDLSNEQVRKIKEDVIKPMIDSYEPMQREDMLLFRDTESERLAEIEKQQIAANKLLSGIFTESVPVQAVPVTEPPVSEPLDEKKLKELKAEQEKKIKAGMKLTHKANEFTLDIFEAEEKCRKADMAPMKRAVEILAQMKRQLTPDEYAERERTFGPMLSFFNSAVLDKKGVQTQDSKHESEIIMVNIAENYDSEVSRIKREMIDKKFDASHYTAEYIGTHYEEVRTELDRLRSFSLIFKKGSEPFNAATPEEKTSIERLFATYELAKSCFDSALASCGLSVNKGGIVSPDTDEGPVPLQDTESLEKLKAHVASNEEAENRLCDDKIEEYRAELRTHDEEKYGEMWADKSKEGSDTEFIKAKLTNAYQYETLSGIKQLIESQPDKYMENKDLIDRLFTDAMRLMETISDLSADVGAYNSILFDTTKATTARMRNRVSRLSEQTMVKYNLINDRIGSIQAIIRHYLIGRSMGEADAFVLESEYHVEEQDRVMLKEQLRQQARHYVTHTEHLQREFEDITPDEAYVSEKFRAIQDFKSEKLEGEPGEKLLEHLEELIDMKFWSEKVLEHGRIPSADGSGRTVLEKLLNKPVGSEDDPGYDEQSKKFEVRKACFKAKCGIISGIVMKARAIAMFKSSKYEPLTDDVLTEDEKEVARDRGTTLDYAKHLYSAGKSKIIASNNRVANNSEVLDCLMEYSNPVYLPKKHLYTEDVFKVGRKVNSLLGTDGYTKGEESTARILYKQNLEQISSRKKLLEEEYLAPSQALEIEDEIKALEKENTDLRILFALSKKFYRVAGEQDVFIREAIFRSFDNADQEHGIRDMADDKYLEMLVNLSAGAFLDEHSTKAEVEEARKANLSGLRTYYEGIKAHYNYLEDKYGYQIFSTAYCIEHEDEINQDFANVQVDNNLVVSDKLCLDMENDSDARLYHQVVLFNGLGGTLTAYRNSVIVSGGHYDEPAMAEIREGTYWQEKASRDYLMAHPRTARA